MQPPELIAIAAADLWSQPARRAQFAFMVGRWASACQQHGVRGGLWLRDHGRSPDGWHEPLEGLMWVGQLGLQLGISAPAEPPATFVLDRWRALGLGWLHVGERDAARWQAQPPENMPWSRACHDLSGVAGALAAGAHWVTLSPVFATPSKPDAVPMGLAGLAQATAMFPHQIVALGGVDAATAADVRAHGAASCATLRAWQQDPASLAASWTQRSARALRRP